VTLQGLDPFEALRALGLAVMVGFLAVRWVPGLRRWAWLVAAAYLVGGLTIFATAYWPRAASPGVGTIML
jgi:hypothetical protein